MSVYQWFKASCSLQLYLFIHRIMNLFTLSERTMHVLTLATHRRRVQYHSASINIKTVHTWHRYRFGYIFGTFRHNNETCDLAETIDMPWHYAFLFFFNIFFLWYRKDYTWFPGNDNSLPLIDSSKIFTNMASDWPVVQSAANQNHADELRSISHHLNRQTGQ